MEERAQQKRRIINLGIKTKVQMKYLKLLIGAIIIIMIAVVITFYGTFHLTLSTAQLGRYAEARLSEVFSWLNWLLFIECIIFTIIAGFLSLKLTHRIAGPLFRLEKRVHEIADKGIAEEIKIRKEDELQDLVNEINSLIVKLAKRG